MHDEYVTKNKTIIVKAKTFRDTYMPFHFEIYDLMCATHFFEITLCVVQK